MSNEEAPPSKRIRLSTSRKGQVVTKDDVQYLNSDCLAMIFSYLDFVALIRVSGTCKVWSKVAKSVLKTRKIYLTYSAMELILRSNSGIEAVADHCPNVTRLTAPQSYNRESPLTITLFSQFPNLTHLWLSRSGVSEKVLHTILVNSNALERLDVSHNTRDLTGKCFNQHLPSSLKHLNVSDTSCVKELVMAACAERCPKLVSLDVAGLPFSDKHTDAVKGMVMPSLKSLTIGYRREKGALNFKPVTTPNLEYLSVSYCTLGSSLNTLAKKCPKLKSFFLFYCTVGKGIDKFVSSLKGLKLIELGLEEFDYGKRKQKVDQVELAILMIIDYWRNLEVLSFTYLDELNNGHFSRLIQGLPLLRLLNIKNCKKVSSGFEKLLTALKMGKRNQALEVRIKDCGCAFNHQMPQFNINLKTCDYGPDYFKHYFR